MAWLNPLTWIKILSLLKSLYDAAVATYKWAAALFRKKAQEKEIGKIQEVEHQIDEANKIEDDETRIKEKANAACKMEQALDPNRKCGA